MPRENALVARFGTRAALNTAASTNDLLKGEILLIDDEARFAVATSVSTYQAMMKQGEATTDPWTWQKLSADVSNSTITLAAVTGLSFAATANTTYLVEVAGAFTSAATTTGIALALDIPSGSIIGLSIASTSATTLGGIEQIADNATTGATSGVRAANTTIPVIARFVVAIGATSGNVQLQFRSEIASSAVTMKANLTVMGIRIIP